MDCVERVPTSWAVYDPLHFILEKKKVVLVHQKRTHKLFKGSGQLTPPTTAITSLITFTYSPKLCGGEKTTESMWHLISYVARSLGCRRNRRARVADESALEENPPAAAATGGRGGAIHALLALARAPLEVAACAAAAVLGRPEEDSAAQAVRGDRLRPDEMSHLMVRDSMRYVIYV